MIVLDRVHKSYRTIAGRHVVLRDVTVGESAGCRHTDSTKSPGWLAAEGYDAVTGLGVVNDFNDFMAALM